MNNSSPLFSPLVLVVDDDPDTRELYRLVFEGAGYRVAEAASVAALRTPGSVPDVVVTDWMLPDGTGLDVCRQVHPEGARPGIPLVAVTGLVLAETVEHDARRAGLHAVIQKPAYPDDILSAVQGALVAGVERRVRDAAARARRYAERLYPTTAERPGDYAGCVVNTLAARAAERSGQVTLLLANDEGRYVAASEQAEALTGYGASELTKMSVWDLTPETSSTRGRQLWAQFITSGCQQGQYLVRRRDGSLLPAQYSALANIAPGLHVSALTPSPAAPAGASAS